MRVTRLEIFGFKSFVERFVLNFDRNLIGIVGPNGCGKSNVVDALRWVLGETYAKQLRGSAFDDLIFNGSDSRRPLGMAEVSITIRPTEGWEELATPAVFMQPAATNGNHAPAESTRSDLEAATVDLDAEVAPLLPLNGDDSHDDLSLHEQAAPAVLSEIPGLLGAAEIQFTRRLYRSGESEYFINRVPCRLRDMTDIYRLIGLGARGLSIVQQGEIGSLISKKPIERRELLEEAAGISGFRTRMEAAQRRLDRTAENMLRLRDIILEVEKQVRQLQRQAKRARDRNELKTELRQYELDLFAARSTKISGLRRHHAAVQENLDAELERVRSEFALIEATQGELHANLESFEVELSDKRRERDQLQNLLHSERTRISEIKLEMALVEERRSLIAKNLSRIDERSIEVEREVETRGGNLTTLDAAVDEAQRGKEQAQKFLADIQHRGSEANKSEQLSLPTDFQGSRHFSHAEELKGLQIELETLPRIEEELRLLTQTVSSAEKEQRESMGRVHNQRLKLTALESELGALNGQLEALAEHVGKTADIPESDKVASAGLNQVLLAGIRVSEDLQRALAAVLGEKGQYLVTSKAKDLARNFAQRLKQNAEQHGSRLGVIDENALQDALVATLSPAELAAAPSAKAFINCVHIEPNFERVVRAFLADVILVDNLEEALALQAVEERSSTVVTKQGAILQPWGWYTTEGKGSGFALTRKISEKLAEKTSVAENYAGAQEEEKKSEHKVAGLRDQLKHKQDERERLLTSQRRLVNLKREEHEHEQRLHQAVLQEERRRRDASAAEERTAQDLLRKAASMETQAVHELETHRRGIEQLRKEVAALAAQKNELQHESAELIKKHVELETALNYTSSTGINAEKIQAQSRALEEQIHELDEKRNPVRLALAEKSEILAQSRREVSQFQEQQTKVTLEIEKADIELKMLHEEISRQYADTPPTGAEQIELITSRAEGDIDALIAELQEEGTKIRRRIEREGDVDPQSIDMYETEEARLNGMQTEYADLEAATEILERTIRQLKEISRTRFLETFASVSHKFSELVPRLFGGGAGRLELVNPEDPLSSGVEIFVRPPGKKVTNMELLSGGEKALVAVSVLLSMFLHRPSPICVLDEVDAPLDESNLERYLNLITEIASGTQFLIITHNKRSMAQAQRLIGITMQERGVSAALSVSLEESEGEIDRWIANS